MYKIVRYYTLNEHLCSMNFVFQANQALFCELKYEKLH